MADDFGLTEENCPGNAAFTTLERLKKLKEKNAAFFGLYGDDKQIGFVAVEKASDAVYYVERLAVLPEYRHEGHGKKLMDFACDHVRKRKGETVSIGIINKNVALKNWYKTQGFVETGTRQFEHLPFTVCFLEKGISGPDS